MAIEGFYQMPAKASPYLRPNLNIGCLMDIPTGAPVLAENDRYLTNGGHNGSIIIVGPGNSYKSAIVDHINETCAFRIHRYSSGQKYDTENNVFMPGMELRLSRIIGPNNEPDWFQSGRWLVTESSIYKGDKWFEMAKEWMYGKSKPGSGMRVEFPILDRERKPIKNYLPTFITLDSLSKFESTNVVELRDSTDLTNSKQNMLHMNSGKIKRNMIDELPDLIVGTNTYLTGTVHYGEKYQLDPYAPVHKSLQHLDNGMELKGVPKNISYLALTMWLIKGVSKLTNKSDKNQIEYPIKGNGADNNPEDLNIINMKMLRCKTGPSGYSINVVVSQKYGVLEGITNFHFLRVHGGYGLTGDMSVSGNFKDSYCVLMPEVKLTRTTIRSLLDSDRRLFRAIQICSDMLQMQEFWREHLNKIDTRLLELTPELLYEKVKQQGYDWDTLLDTRYWYTLDEEIHDQLELSTIDIMRMAYGLYHPFWLENDKKTIKKKYLKLLNESNKLSDIIEDTSEKK